MSHKKSLVKNPAPVLPAKPELKKTGKPRIGVELVRSNVTLPSNIRGCCIKIAAARGITFSDVLRSVLVKFCEENCHEHPQILKEYPEFKR